MQTLLCCVPGSMQANPALQSHQSWGPGAGRTGFLHIRFIPDIYGGYDRYKPGVNVEMCVQCDESPGGESTSVHHVQQVRWCYATWCQAGMTKKFETVTLWSQKLVFTSKEVKENLTWIIIIMMFSKQRFIHRRAVLPGVSEGRRISWSPGGAGLCSGSLYDIV